jgi:hypothetical protein
MIGDSTSMDSTVQELADVEDVCPSSKADSELRDILLSNELILELDDEGRDILGLSMIDFEFRTSETERRIEEHSAWFAWSRNAS